MIPSRHTPDLRRAGLALWLVPALLGAVPAPAPAADTCPAGSSPLLIVGTFHMDNPGLDAVERRIDDVLGERRQREIESLVAALARFRPTKVAIESPFKDSKWPARYDAWRDGDYELGRNEVQQLGFRLAARLGHETLHPIDFPMWMNGWAADEIDYSQIGRGAIDEADDDEEEGEEEGDGAAEDSAGSELSEEDRLLRRSTVGEYLRHLHDPRRIADDHSGYMELLMPEPGQIGLYARSDLLVHWYKRNFRMFANLNRITTFGDDRVLLLVGAGHLAILRDLARSSPQWCLEETRAYLP